MAGRVSPVWSGASLAAPAFPVRCTPGDNLAIHVAVAEAPPGSALCVDVGDERDLGYWGEVLTTAAEARDLAGLVIDGCVRDVDALRSHAFPVFSTGVELPGATKNRSGEIGGTVTVGGVEVSVWDWVVADRDGVVVVPGDSIDTIADAARRRAVLESGFFEALRAGATTVELLGLDDTLITRRA